MFTVLLVSKLTPQIKSLISYLKLQISVCHTHSAQEAALLFRNRTVDAILIEGDQDTKFIMDSLDRLCMQHIPVPIIIYSAQRAPEFAIEVMKRGVDDYVFKTKDFDQLRITLLATIQKRYSFRTSKPTSATEQIIDELRGESKKVSDIQRFIATCAPANETVMLYGESGTGKTFIARLIHKYSLRRENQFRIVNCAAIPEALMESELFGSEVGAFTGAIKRKGVFTRAHRGTLLLDELGDLPLTSQAKLLQVLDESRYTPLGSEHEFAVDVRFISATNKTIMQMIKDGEFRADLYYRMAVLSYTVPPLRERVEDIPTLAWHFLRTRDNNESTYFTPAAIDKMMAYAWPGNIRELKNCVIRAAVQSGGDRISARCISFDV